MRDYLLYCSACHEYTALGKYIEKEGHFQGEYSLLHNSHTDSDELLCRFMIRHTGHELRLHTNRTEHFSRILRTASRFMEMDIDAFLERELDRKERMRSETEMERGLGQLQLNVLRQQLEEEAERIAGLPTSEAAESQFLLGKEEGVKRALAMLKELMERTRMMYR
ncbi:hypothetical protein ACVNS2_33620 [Paenibacillus caseinilyticus]|uniref:Uncharacterized protein n=1 Tax=Paenibacillus mucilaginosus K02 TaxID=997761 RepID=I0BTE9_9BACL|nr:hypothetical protein [Paenibacillus mucilaginosus]AFH65646.1 hypothetical protein B2K_33945 [Paenibacillus mucilaginosus K02]